MKQATNAELIHQTQKKKTKRNELVDSLRGFALLAIVLLHNLEHYNLYYIPSGMPEWLNGLDKDVWNTIFFLFAGKAYAAFSLLFGYSFYMQYHRQRKEGQKYRGRFAWRMCILALIAQLHALIYNGDILLLYSVVGLILIPISKRSTKTIFTIALICLAQPVEWLRLLYGYFNVEASTYGEYFLPFAQLCNPIMKSGTALELMKSNITHGQLYSNLWQLENGRLFQSAGLFMLGMLLGKRRYFIDERRSPHLWKRLLLVGTMLFIPLYMLLTIVAPEVESEIMHRSFGLIVTTYCNISMLCIWMSLLVLLWFKTSGTRLQKIMAPYGRMSLTNYITQSIVGVTIYYGFGLGLYQYSGATASVLIALLMVIIQVGLSHLWLTFHRQGPLEWMWRKLTWIHLKRK